MTGGHDDDAVRRAFYAADPSAYFRERLSLLTVRAGAATRLAALAGDGVAWGPLTLGAAAPNEATEDERLTTAFVVTDSRELLYGASTALVLHFLAHSDPDLAPWVAAPRLARERAWVLRLPDLARDRPHDATLVAVADVFLGGVRDSPSPAWSEALASSTRLLRIAAARCQAEELRPAGRSLATAGLPEPAPGGALHAAHDRVWLTHLVVIQLGALWKIARARHLDTPHDGLDLVTAAALDALDPADPTDPTGLAGHTAQDEYVAW